MNKIYLIDDSRASHTESKFQQLTAFIKYLNRTFNPQQFEWGAMTSVAGVQLHNDLLSGDPDQLIGILSDPDALILVDVLMPVEDCVSAGKEILTRYPHCAARALEIGKILTADSAITTIPDDYLLCAAIIASGEANCARVAVVSTEAQQPARGAVGVLGPKEIGWNAAAWGLVPNSDNIRAWVFQNLLNDVKEWRAQWKKLQGEASAETWTVLDPKGTSYANRKLFLSNIGRNHDLTDGNGTFTHTAVDARNERALAAATAWFEDNIVVLNNSQERLAVMRAAYRDSQVPVFVVQRILGTSEVTDATQAMSAQPPSWDVPALLFGAKKIASSVPRPQFDLQLESGEWKLSIAVQGSANELDKVEAALNQGAVRRYRDRGSTGEFTLGIELLSPTSRRRKATEIIISRGFNQQQL